MLKNSPKSSLLKFVMAGQTTKKPAPAGVKDFSLGDLFVLVPAISSTFAFFFFSGYDVWMPNIRGNSYSRNHTTLDPCTSCSEFWSFGLEEPALLDYPTFIDYIVNKSGHADMHFVGYSMGTTQYLILLSEQPEYNARFRSGFLLGPTAFAGNHTNPFGALAPYGDSVKYIFDLLGVHEFMPNFLEIKSWLAHTTCHISNLHSKACRNLYALFVGMDPSNLNMTMVPTYMSHMPCGSSTTQFKHYAQLAENGGRFTKLDLGAVMNLVKYGQSEPPEYEVAKVTAKTLLFSGEADTVSTPADADKLASVMGDAVVHNEVVDYSGWSHLGFIWNTDARTVLYDRMIDMMQKMDREEKKKSS
jgi:pimeloyl-ACP methyl ester carboxylesterase